MIRNIVIELEKVDKINTADILYDTKLKELVRYPINVDVNTFDFVYIQKNCFRLKVIDNN